MTELIRRLDPGRFKVHVACFHREGAWLPRVVERAASVVEFPIHGFARPSTVWQLMQRSPGGAGANALRWCRHAICTRTSSACLERPWPGCRSVSAAGGSSTPTRPTGRSVFSGWPIASATKVAANSPAARADARAGRSRASSIVVIPNGLDLNAFADAKANRIHPDHHHRRQPAAGEEPRDAAGRGGAAAADPSRPAVSDRRRRPAAPRARRAVARARTRPRTSSSWDIGKTSRRCSRRRTPSSCPRGPRRFPTARSRRWRPAFRSWPATSAGCAI